MAAEQRNFPKNVSAQLRNRANDFLNSKKHANNLADILQMFEVETDNYTPLLLTIEVIFTEVLKRGDLLEELIALKPSGPLSKYKQWLRESYETAWARTLDCIKRGNSSSRLQALVTACKLLQAEGRYPMQQNNSFFPSIRLKNIFSVLIDSETLMTTAITRFQEFCEYSDVQQYGLRVLAILAYRKPATNIYMLNYLELLDKLIAVNLLEDLKRKPKDKGDDDEEHPKKILCYAEGKPNFTYSAINCRRYVNRCWGFACQWSLCQDPRTQRRALLLLVEKVLVLLSQPKLATDMLCDSLDAGGSVSMLALQGVMQLVRYHNVDYPDIYNRLYAMFEPEIFATRHKKRLLHLADVFLSSTHLPEGYAAGFAKRLARLALLASPEDAAGLLQLVANLLVRHPALKSMICYDDAQEIMSADPYVMDETCANSSRAVGSYLWEVCTLQRHWLPQVRQLASQVLAAVDERAQPVTIALPDDDELFDAEVKKRFKTIEMGFVRLCLIPGLKECLLLHYWDIGNNEP